MSGPSRPSIIFYLKSFAFSAFALSSLLFFAADAKAATILDTTVGGADGALGTLGYITSGPTQCFYASQFDYTTSSQIEVTQAQFPVYAWFYGPRSIQLNWFDQSGDSGSASTTITSPATGTDGIIATFEFPAGQHPIQYPYGTPTRFYFTVPTSAAFPFNPGYQNYMGLDVEDGYATGGPGYSALPIEQQLVTNQLQYADCGSGFTLVGDAKPKTIMMALSGGTTQLTFAPNPSDYGLTGTSTAATQDFGFFGNLFRDVLIWLFQPPAVMNQVYQNQLTQLQTKVPWGWWTQISNGFSSVSSTDVATTTALTMQIPHNGVTTTVAIFDIHAAAAVIPSSLLSLIQTIGGVAMWALFGGWIWILVTGNKPGDDSDV